ncbi:MAG: hypothetical protein RL536_158 [Candidatus Parcubacteria bacterium]|jgi:phosphoesterase RecJ-like protein
MSNEISPLIKEKAPLILAEIKKAKTILLHCHPSPDPDSVGSALATKFALEQLGKKVMVIRGDSEIPQAFMHFPGADSILEKNFLEIDLAEFDLFISLDTADFKRVSSRGEVKFPAELFVIDIDHHPTNPSYGSINLVEFSYPATCQILFDLFTLWGVKLNTEIASNLFIGIYTDTGGFKYLGVTTKTFETVTQLSKFIPNISELITRMENSNTPTILRFEAIALNSIQVSDSGKFALASVSRKTLEENNIPTSDIRASEICAFMLTVTDWEITASAVEFEPNKVKYSFRSKDMKKHDVSIIASTFGGGGHKMAAGVTIEMPFEKSKEAVLSKVKELYKI